MKLKIFSFKLHYYTVLVRRHFRYGGFRQALTFALRHMRFWNGCTGPGKPYAHIGRKETNGDNSPQ